MPRSEFSRVALELGLLHAVCPQVESLVRPRGLSPPPGLVRRVLLEELPKTGGHGMRQACATHSLMQASCRHLGVQSRALHHHDSANAVTAAIRCRTWSPFARSAVLRSPSRALTSHRPLISNKQHHHHGRQCCSSHSRSSLRTLISFRLTQPRPQVRHHRKLHR